MKPKSISAAWVCLALLHLFSATVVYGDSPKAARKKQPLGLLRLKDESKPGEAKAVAPADYTVVNLAEAHGDGTSKLNRWQLDILAVDSAREWSRPLRATGKNVAYVSFLVSASPNTILEVGGARLGITQGSSSGSLQLMFDDSTTGQLRWRPLGLYVRLERYAGRRLATLPVLTAQIDRTAGVWNLYAGSRLLADNLPFAITGGGDGKFNVRAGTDGAWLCGLVMSDENPLYEDANANGVDDRFEMQARGRLLAASATIPERRLLARDWARAQRSTPVRPLITARPVSDR